MSDDEKKASSRFAGWKRAGEQVSQPGSSDDILRKAAAINPALKDGKTTRELAQAVNDAKKGVAAPVAAPKDQRAPPPRINDVAGGLPVVKAWLAREDARLAAVDAEIAAELEAVAKEREALIAASRQRVEGLARAVDSPKTQALLQAEAPFLRTLKMK